MNLDALRLEDVLAAYQSGRIGREEVARWLKQAAAQAPAPATAPAAAPAAAPAPAEPSAATRPT